MVEKIIKTDKEWQQKLTPEQFHVCRQAGTETPFSGKFNSFKEKGIFLCVCCADIGDNHVTGQIAPGQ